MHTYYLYNWRDSNFWCSIALQWTSSSELLLLSILLLLLMPTASFFPFFLLRLSISGVPHLCFWLGVHASNKNAVEPRWVLSKPASVKIIVPCASPFLRRLRQPCSVFDVHAHCAYSFFRGVMLLTSRYHSVQHLLACFTSETFSSMCFIINCSITSLAKAAASIIMPMTTREYHHQSCLWQDGLCNKDSFPDNHNTVVKRKYIMDDLFLCTGV